MAFDPALADRIRELIATREDEVEEKKMFGGLAFMVNNKICVTTRDDRIMVRLSPHDYEIEVHGEGLLPHDAQWARGKRVHIRDGTVDTNDRGAAALGQHGVGL